MKTDTFVFNYRDQTFPVVLDQVFTYCSMDFGPLLRTEPLQNHQLAEQHGISAPAKGFRSGVYMFIYLYSPKNHMHASAMRESSVKIRIHVMPAVSWVKPEDTLRSTAPTCCCRAVFCLPEYLIEYFLLFKCNQALQ